MRILKVIIELELDDATPDDVWVDDLMEDVQEICEEREFSVYNQYWEVN